jgi:hypothetical protein
MDFTHTHHVALRRNVCGTDTYVLRSGTHLVSYVAISTVFEEQHRLLRHLPPQGV